MTNDATWPTRFGLFLQPLHDPRGTDPTVQLEGDLQTLELLDDLGFDEAWIGEHHSGGWEIIGAPDVFIAAAAERTKHIRLGTGVVSVTYHHPLIVADRMCLLDHLTRGRIMLGVGPGALAQDAYMFGVDPTAQRPRLAESLDAMLALLRGETVTRQTDWFTMQDAHLHLLPYTDPCFEVAVAGAVSPSGARQAGQHGISLLTVGATSSTTFDALANHWNVLENEAGHYGQATDRRRWRMTGPMHLAETEKQAREEVAHGLERWAWYYGNITAHSFFDTTGTLDEIIDELTSSGFAVIGTPDQAIAQIKRIAEWSGGFGSYLLMDLDWTRPECKRRSYELFAEYVFPEFRTNSASRERSEQFAVDVGKKLNSRLIDARNQATAAHEAEQAGRQVDDKVSQEADATDQPHHP